jgi:hypothetical protein
LPLVSDGPCSVGVDRMAFNILDTNRSGTITVEEIEVGVLLPLTSPSYVEVGGLTIFQLFPQAVYDVSHNPDVKSGKKTPRQALQEFMSQWDRFDNDGIVTLDEFEDYYKEVSASIDDDDYFELMIRNAWRIAGGSGMAANTANRRVLVTNKDGSQSVQTVENELGLRGGDIDGIRSRLARQGVAADNIELYGGMDTTEKAKNQVPVPHPLCVGYISY